MTVKLLRQKVLKEEDELQKLAQTAMILCFMLYVNAIIE
jgi:hypothetical protein